MVQAGLFGTIASDFIAMHSEQIRQLRFWLVGIMLAFFGAFYGYFYFSQSRRITSVAAGAGGERTEQLVKESSQLRQLYQLEGRDPEGALKMADEIIAKPASDYERRAAMGRRPGLIKSAAIKRLEAGDRAAAQALRERLEKSYPASDQVGYLQREWKRVLANLAAVSLRGGNREASDAAFRELWAAGAGDSERFAFDQRYEAFLTRWHDSLNKKSPDATELMFEVLTVFSHVGYLDQAANSMSQASGTYEEIAALGDAQLATARRHTAVVIWAGALARYNMTHFARFGEKPSEQKQREAVQQKLKAKISSGWMELAERLRAGERIPYVLLTPRDAYAAAIDHGRGLVEEMEALTKLIAFETAEATRLAEPLLAVTFEQLRDPAVGRQEAYKSYEQRANELTTQMRNVVRERGVRLWECCLDTPGFDPWAGVPVSLRDTIDGVSAEAAARGGATPSKPALPESERRKKLLAHYRSDAWQTPLAEVETLTALARQIYARWALFGLTGETDGALNQLRWVLRAKDDPALQKPIIETLRARLSRARQNGEFTLFFALSGFYAAEVGLPAAGDSFRDEFRAGLEAVAKDFRPREKMKYVFTLSLLAQCFPEEPLGRQAHADAFAAAFDLVAKNTPEAIRAPFFPSTVPGHSIQLINNNTDHHLLAFYRGKQLIAAHSWPRRRGTVVLPDGDYEVVVLSPSSNVVPYRAKGTYSHGVRVSDYTIHTTDAAGQTRPTPGAVATGDYKLLYAPPALGAVTVEPRSGIPLLSRGR